MINNDDLKLDSLLSSIEREEDPPTTIVNQQWDYIVSFVVDLHNPEDIEIITRQFIPVCGGMSAECYYSECMDNAYPNDFLPTLFTGHLDLTKHPAGIYRFVYGVKTHGGKYWTDCGYEYDSWEVYNLISQYKYTKEEEPYCISPEEEQ